MVKSIPDTLTLVADTSYKEEGLRTIVVEDDSGFLLIAITQNSKRVGIALNEEQAKKLVGRINKFFRENR